MSARIITPSGVEEVSDTEFFTRVFGCEPPSEEECAERRKRRQEIDRYAAIERQEYARARKEREELLREGWRDGETYEQFTARANEPFSHARERIREEMAAIAEAEQLTVCRGDPFNGKLAA